MAKKTIVHGHKYKSLHRVYHFTCRNCMCQWYDDEPRRPTEEEYNCYELFEIPSEDGKRVSECPECESNLEPVYSAIETQINKELWKSVDIL